MEIVEFVLRASTFNINILLSEGYRVKTVVPVHGSAGGNGSYAEWGAYFVLEKEEK